MSKPTYSFLAAKRRRRRSALMDAVNEHHERMKRQFGLPIGSLSSLAGGGGGPASALAGAAGGANPFGGSGRGGPRPATTTPPPPPVVEVCKLNYIYVASVYLNIEYNI